MNLPKLFKRHTNDRVPFKRPVPGMNIVRARYIGVRKRLSGKIALVMNPGFATPRAGVMTPPYVMAQFNDMTQPEAHGWAVFATSDFEPDHA